MIVQIRVDERLIHGQVALVWLKALKATGVVVANDDAENNDLVKTTLKMAVPEGIKLLIRSVDNAIEVFNNPKGKNMRMFVLTKTVEDALKIAKHCDSDILKAVNIANVGRFDGIPTKEKTAILDGYFTEKELQACRELVKINTLDVYHQIIPEKVQESVKKSLEENGLL